MTITARPPAADNEEAGILVVEPDASEGKRLLQILEDGGFKATLARDGGAAIDDLVRNRYELLVVDGELPELPGKDLVSVVRAYDVEVPIIVIARSAAPWEGAGVGLVSKPATADALVKAVQRAKQSRRQTQKLRRELLSTPPKSQPEELSMIFERALDELYLAFQPIVEQDQRVFGYEALMRSREPKMSSPPQILAAAERLSRLDDLGRRVRSVAASAFAEAPADAHLFVNLHSSDLLDKSLYDSSTPLSSIAPRVVLEITERAPIEHVEDVPARLSILRFHGFRLAIDDLGAGYAGLNSFATVEPEFVKLDMSLVRNVHSSPVRKRLVHSMLEACRDLGTRVVAEGIEGVEELKTLHQMGCDLFQGYLFAKPATAFERPRVVNF
jgi:EAL domain-containing protein (putative c-di-GMP-specific phosphodiesterase class I)